jgi:hypothetical protein
MGNHSVRGMRKNYLTTFLQFIQKGDSVLQCLQLMKKLIGIVHIISWSSSVFVVVVVSWFFV